MNLILISHISVIDILYKLLFDLKYHINILNLFNLKYNQIRLENHLINGVYEW